MPEIPADAVRREMERIIASPVFIRSEKLGRFLRYIVEQTLAGKADGLKEYSLGVHVYDRREDYEPKVDATVRVEATRLRTKLLEFYTRAPATGLRIELPKGSYVPRFTTAEEAVAKPVARRTERWGLALAAGVVAMLGALSWSWRVAAAPSPLPAIAAQQLYFDAHRTWARGYPDQNLDAAIGGFQKAVAADPAFAGAWADFAAALDRKADADRPGREEWVAKAESAARRAIELDGKMVAPYRLLGSRYLLLGRLGDALRVLERATALDPGNGHSQYLYVSTLAVSGRLERAEAQIDRAALMAPRSSFMAALRAQVYIWNHRYRQARAEAERACDLDRDDSFSRWVLGLAAQLEGDFSHAEAQYEECRRRQPDPRATSALAHLLAVRGRVDDANRLLKQMADSASIRDGFHYIRAMVHAASREPALAIDALERSWADREGSAPYLTVDPRFDSLHEEPRFQALVGNIRRGSE